MSTSPPTGELANPAHDWMTALDLTCEESALAALRTEAANHRPPRTVYHLFQNMEDKDGHLHAVLQTRKNGVLARERRVVPCDHSAAAVESARLVEELLDAIPGFDQALLALLDALGKGFSVVEILWSPRRDGRLGIGGLAGRPQPLFAFARDGSLRLLSLNRSEKTRVSTLRDTRGAMEGDARTELVPPPGGSHVAQPSRPAPAAKFLVLSFGSPHANPYGKGLCLKCYWYTHFKKHNLKFWAIYNERFGAPAVVGKYAPGTSEDERTKLLEVIEALQSDTGVTLPETMALEFLEARRSGDGRTYRDFADWCNDEISKVVLGATLVASEGRRSGSLALGQVHQRIRSEYVESDAKILMDVVNRQLIPWLVRFNLGPEAPVPRWEIDTQPDEDLRGEAEVDRALVNLGVPVPLSHFYHRYRRPVPRPGEKTLRFDDTNLYQYHLQFGVLTINEVRASLGLPPVPWGDTPPRLPSDAGAQSEDTATRANSLRSTKAPDPQEPVGDPEEEEPTEAE